MGEEGGKVGRGEGGIVINSDTLMLSSILCSNMALKTGERAVRGGGGEGRGRGKRRDGVLPPPGTWLLHSWDQQGGGSWADLASVCCRQTLAVKPF